jgi:hypothetical protein
MPSHKNDRCIGSYPVLECERGVGADGWALAPRYQAVAPALNRYQHNTPIEGVWKRPGLSSRDRSLVTVVTLNA